MNENEDLMPMADAEEEKEEGGDVLEEQTEAPTTPDTTDISEDEISALTAHPMFSRFARGRQGAFREILSDFREMLSVASDSQGREALSAKMTPSATQAVMDVALTERQRAIARAAGMSYREYYHILND